MASSAGTCAANASKTVKLDSVKSVNDFTLLATLGTGTFGRVRLSKYNEGVYALKILRKCEIIRLKQVDHIKSEISLLDSIEHPFIVNMVAHFQDLRRVYMVLEFVPGGEVFSHLRREGRFSNDASRLYCAEIVLAFQYLHKPPTIVYRDLKPENLLLTRKGHIKITDFGFAKIVEDRTWTLCGTPEYLAPEIIQSKGHGKSVDWWALGVLCFEMLAGYPPFYDENPFGIYQKILSGKIDWPRHFEAKAKLLIQKLLKADRTQRIGCLRNGAEDVKKASWFMKPANKKTKLDWEKVLNCGYDMPILPNVKAADDTSNFDDYPDSQEECPSITQAEQTQLFDAQPFAPMPQ